MDDKFTRLPNPSNTRNKHSLLRQATTRKAPPLKSKAELCDISIIDRIQEFLKTPDTKPAANIHTCEGKELFLFDIEGNSTTSEPHFVLISGASETEIELLRMLDKLDTPVPPFIKLKPGLLMKWIPGLTISFDKFADFSATKTIANLERELDLNNAEIVNNLLTSLEKIASSIVHVFDLQIQIEYTTGNAYIIDPNEGRTPLHQNRNLSALISTLREYLQ